MTWCPRITVAAVVEQEGRFLMVEETQPEGRVYNQPAGHLEPGESLLDAVVREVREETGYDFTPQAVVGLYRWHHPRRDLTFLRLTVVGEVHDLAEPTPPDPEVVAVHWLTPGAIRELSGALRSPMVLASIEDYLKGARHGLDLLQDLAP